MTTVNPPRAYFRDNGYDQAPPHILSSALMVAKNLVAVLWVADTIVVNSFRR